MYIAAAVVCLASLVGYGAGHSILGTNMAHHGHQAIYICACVRACVRACVFTYYMYNVQYSILLSCRMIDISQCQRP